MQDLTPLHPTAILIIQLKHLKLITIIDIYEISCGEINIREHHGLRITNWSDRDCDFEPFSQAVLEAEHLKQLLKKDE